MSFLFFFYILLKIIYFQEKIDLYTTGRNIKQQKAAKEIIKQQFFYLYKKTVSASFSILANDK